MLQVLFFFKKCYLSRLNELIKRFITCSQVVSQYLISDGRQAHIWRNGAFTFVQSCFGGVVVYNNRDIADYSLQIQKRCDYLNDSIVYTVSAGSTCKPNLFC